MATIEYQPETKSPQPVIDISPNPNQQQIETPTLEDFQGFFLKNGLVKKFKRAMPRQPNRESSSLGKLRTIGSESADSPLKATIGKFNTKRPEKFLQIHGQDPQAGAFGLRLHLNARGIPEAIVAQVARPGQEVITYDSRTNEGSAEAVYQAAQMATEGLAWHQEQRRLSLNPQTAAEIGSLATAHNIAV